MPVFSRPLLDGCVFPTELWDLVIDSADREDLAALSLVARSWRVRAQYRLLRDLYVVAGPRCILWYTLRTSRGAVPYPKILPDSFQSLYPSFTRLAPRARGLVKTITFRGLSHSERLQALELSMGYGEDPYITLCTIYNFTKLLPGVRIVNLSHITWTTCLHSLLLPRTHRCVKDEDRRHLDVISVTTVDHGRLQDSVFDVLKLTSSCTRFRAHDIGWDQSSLSTRQYPRLNRSDIQDFEVTLPSFFPGMLLTRHMPVMEGLKALVVNAVSLSTYSEVVRMLKRSAGTLERLSLSLREETLSLEMLQDLPFLQCRSVKYMRIHFVLCAHAPDDSCAGSSIFPVLLGLLPENVESLSFVISSPAVGEDARRRVSTMPGWEEMIPLLQGLRCLRSVEMMLPAPEDEDNQHEHRRFHSWQQYLTHMLLPVKDASPISTI